MKIRTVTVREGENMGPIDWNYDFRSHFNNYGCSDKGRDEACERAKARLRIILDRLERNLPVAATNYGGWPRCGIYPVVEAGMYDGWPWWQPVPSVYVMTFLGGEWYTFDRITDIYESVDTYQSIRV